MAMLAVGTGTWGIAAVIPKYLSLRLLFDGGKAVHETLEFFNGIIGILFRFYGLDIELTGYASKSRQENPPTPITKDCWRNCFSVH